MIDISVDEGYAFDYLAILWVKEQTDNFYKCAEKIASQLGETKHSEVMGSQEFRNLILANNKVFDLVDRVKKDPCLGAEVDAANYQRYLAKTSLQKKFWPLADVKEIKIGY
jgi:hypothetical protein